MIIIRKGGVNRIVGPLIHKDFIIIGFSVLKKKDRLLWDARANQRLWRRHGKYDNPSTSFSFINNLMT